MGIGGAIVEVRDVDRTEVESSSLKVPIQINYQSAEADGDKIGKACFEGTWVIYTIRVASPGDVDAWKCCLVDRRLSTDISVGLDGVSEPAASCEPYSPETWGPRTCQAVRHR